MPQPWVLDRELAQVARKCTSFRLSCLARGHSLCEELTSSWMLQDHWWESWARSWETYWWSRRITISLPLVWGHISNRLPSQSLQVRLPRCSRNLMCRCTLLQGKRGEKDHQRTWRNVRTCKDLVSPMRIQRCSQAHGRIPQLLSELSKQITKDWKYFNAWVLQTKEARSLPREIWSCHRKCEEEDGESK